MSEPDAETKALMMAMHAELMDVADRYEGLGVYPAALIFLSGEGAGVFSPMAKDELRALLRALLKCYDEGRPPTFSVSRGTNEAS